MTTTETPTALARIESARRRAATDAIIDANLAAVVVAVTPSGWATVSKRGDLTFEQRRDLGDALVLVARGLTAWGDAGTTVEAARRGGI